MKLSFTTLGCPAWKPEEIPQQVKTFGFDGVELRVHPEGLHLSPEATDDQARQLAESYRQGGLPVISLMGYSSFAHLEAGPMEDNRKLLAKLIHLAGVMKVPYIRTFAGMVPKGATHQSVIQRAAEVLKPLAELAGKNGVKIGLETHDDWTNPQHTLALAKAVNSPNFGIVYDILNVCDATQGDWKTAYQLFKDLILYCHVKDNFPLPGPEKKRSYVAVGAGDLPLKEILAQFKKDGYDGIFSFEWEKRWHEELEAPERVFPQFTHKMRSVWNSL
ncbi:MAG: sugar phosphate isomerase/epimerase [Phycisphaeraceae bacterium]|nr:sugar phosphate isomerase/epimerase [Phycisphaeraceae bacterium]